MTRITAGPFEGITREFGRLLSELNAHQEGGEGLDLYQLRSLSCPSTGFSWTSKKEILHIFHELFWNYDGSNAKIVSLSRKVKDLSENFERDAATRRFIDKYKPGELRLATMMERDILHELFGYEAVALLLMRMISLFEGIDPFSRVQLEEAFPVAFNQFMQMRILNNRGIKAITAARVKEDYEEEAFNTREKARTIFLALSYFGYVSRYQKLSEDGTPLLDEHGKPAFHVEYFIGEQELIHALTRGPYIKPSNPSTYHRDYGEIIKLFMNTYMDR